MRALLLPALLALLLAGCSGSSGSSSTTTSGDMGHMNMAMPKTVDVAMKGNKFVNDTVTVAVGDTVRWTNQDSVGHTVTATSGASFDSSPNCAAPIPSGAVCIGPGQSYTYKTEKVGTVEYHCKVHSNMTGKIVVVSPPAMSM